VRRVRLCPKLCPRRSTQCHPSAPAAAKKARHSAPETLVWCGFPGPADAYESEGRVFKSPRARFVFRTVTRAIQRSRSKLSEIFSDIVLKPLLSSRPPRAPGSALFAARPAPEGPGQCRRAPSLTSLSFSRQKNDETLERDRHLNDLPCQMITSMFDRSDGWETGG
jgi:hypothetical protein